MVTAIKQSLRAYMEHTKRYYAPLFNKKNIALLSTVTSFLVVVGIVLNVSVTHASIIKWLRGDVLNEDIVNGQFSYVRNADAPPETALKWHLQMPMMLEGYIPNDVYVSNGASDPTQQKIDDALELTTKPSFFNPDDFELPPDEEWEAAYPDALVLIEDRPPLSGLK